MKLLSPYLKRLDQVEERYRELEERLGDPSIFSRPEEYQKIAKERAALTEIVETYRKYKNLLKQLTDNRQLLDDPDEEIRELAKTEIEELEPQVEELERRLMILLLPKDPNDERNILLEIRAGTGGEEAALFAADLFRMYSRYAERKGWTIEILDANPTGIGGFKEIIALVRGKGAYSRLKYESGVHRVQRVPETESQGRIHTSAVTVAVLPEAEDVEVEIDPSELRIDTYRASGAGGQHVNKTESAVRITHIPTGIVVQCQNERSQHKNKAQAMKILKARLLELRRREQEAKIRDTRRSQVGTGDRSERIRTYNFPQGRVTDHRIGLTLYRLEDILDGDLEEIIEALITHFQTEALKMQAEEMAA
ncbi:peptide chain release factor 1 [Thermosulfuriphilus ammonigenes]|uniref:Peptide chain release factor 1 n=1 Tax=Thermosulfuriphilus ammonigenes TaxID=1936021 RepID=A0A6G7PY62_9BACT|nr:peptide chain release factor 1 [Thermosulfuriphilus ammonigenes]MBA2849389.1 peptide chain release factor 1 [Thermosulfuriphilus ammonigenes]QIJ72461.1 peptide chain release factor 1 [Thermosulfuriphilus ammonigenes]HFB83743.1 peptide chain release factor 1 [Thermodesulfatator sp.]